VTAPLQHPIGSHVVTQREMALHLVISSAVVDLAAQSGSLSNCARRLSAGLILF
jgi:hypothetical protein